MSETAVDILSTPSPAPAPAPAPSPAPSGEATPTPAPAPSPAPAGDAWWKGFTDETTRGFAETRNWKSPEETVKSFMNLERIVGAKANAITVPGAEATPEEWGQFYDKIGRPGSPENYALPDALKEDAAMKAFATEAHKMGLSTKQFESVANFVTQHGEALRAEQERQTDVQAQQEIDGLKREMPGIKYDEFVEYGRRGMQAIGADKEMLGKLEGALGAGGMLKLMNSIGKLGAETPFIDGGHHGNGEMSPEAARLEVEALRKDVNFMKAWTSGDADKVARMNKLHKIAAGGKPQ